MKTRSKRHREISRAVAKAGGRVLSITHGTHLRIVIDYGDGTTGKHTAPVTPSDARSDLNFIAQVRRRAGRRLERRPTEKGAHTDA